MPETETSPHTPSPAAKRAPHRKGPARGGAYGKPTFNQAARIIAKFGGESALATVLGIHRSTPYTWLKARPDGSDGLIPLGMVPRIQMAAQDLGIALTPDDWAPTLST